MTFEKDVTLEVVGNRPLEWDYQKIERGITNASKTFHNKNLSTEVKEEYEDIVGKIVSEEEEVLGLLWEGAKNRAVSATDMNEHSSRSHTIFQFVVEIEMKAEEGQPRLISRSKLNTIS